MEDKYIEVIKKAFKMGVRAKLDESDIKHLISLSLGAAIYSDESDDHYDYIEAEIMNLTSEIIESRDYLGVEEFTGHVDTKEVLRCTIASLVEVKSRISENLKAEEIGYLEKGIKPTKEELERVSKAIDENETIIEINKILKTLNNFDGSILQ